MENKYPSLGLLDRIDQVIQRVEQAEMQRQSRALPWAGADRLTAQPRRVRPRP